MSHTVQRRLGTRTNIRLNRFFRFGERRKVIEGHSSQNLSLGRERSTEGEKERTILYHRSCYLCGSENNVNLLHTVDSKRMFTKSF